MRFLIDESADMNVGRALHSAGHDAKSIAQDWPSILDEEVLQRAAVEERIVVTEDRDFGRIVYQLGQASTGIIYLRYPHRSRLDAPHDVVNLVASHGDRLLGSFVVMQPGRFRISYREQRS
jgi:predicted nuclease of predicted toxin-antitoxin system